MASPARSALHGDKDSTTVSASSQKDLNLRGSQNEVPLSQEEVIKIKSIAMAIKEGAEAQREAHVTQISRLEAEVAMLRSERDLARKRDVALHANGRRQKHRLTSHNFESLANEIKQLAEQVLEEAGQLAEEMTNPPSNSQCSKPVNEEHSRREQMLEIESRESEEDKLKEEVKTLQEDCADLAGEVNRLEDLNFLAETALLKYAGELEQTRSSLATATDRIAELEQVQVQRKHRKGNAKWVASRQEWITTPGGGGQEEAQVDVVKAEMSVIAHMVAQMAIISKEMKEEVAKLTDVCEGFAEGEARDARALAAGEEEDRIKSAMQRLALLLVQSTTDADLELEGIRTELELCEEAQVMALQDAMADRSLLGQDLSELSDEMASLKVLVLEGETELADAKLALAKQQAAAEQAAAAAAKAAEDAAKDAAKAREALRAAREALEVSESRVREQEEAAARLRAAEKEAKERVEEEQEARLFVERELEQVRKKAEEDRAAAAAAAERLRAEWETKMQEAEERIERSREEVENMQRDKEELLMQLKEVTLRLDLQNSPQMQELALHKEKLEEHTRKLHVQINELRIQMRARDEAMRALDLGIQQANITAQAIADQQKVAASAASDAVATAVGSEKRHAYEMAALQEMHRLIRQEHSAKEEELSLIKAEAIAAKKELAAKDAELREEKVKSEHELSQTRAHVLHLLQDHRRRSLSPGPLNNSNESTLPHAVNPRKEVDVLAESETECQLRMESLSDDQLRPELLRIGLANVRLREQLSVKDGLRRALQREVTNMSAQQSNMATIVDNLQDTLNRRKHELEKLLATLAEAECLLMEERFEREREGLQLASTQDRVTGGGIDGQTQTERDETSQVVVLRQQLSSKDEMIRMLKDSKAQLAGDLASLDRLARQAEHEVTRLRHKLHQQRTKPATGSPSSPFVMNGSLQGADLGVSPSSAIPGTPTESTRDSDEGKDNLTPLALHGVVWAREGIADDVDGWSKHAHDEVRMQVVQEECMDSNGIVSGEHGHSNDMQTQQRLPAGIPDYPGYKISVPENLLVSPGSNSVPDTQVLHLDEHSFGAAKRDSHRNEDEDPKNVPERAETTTSRARSASPPSHALIGQDTGRGSEFDRNVALLLKRVQEAESGNPAKGENRGAAMDGGGDKTRGDCVKCKQPVFSWQLRSKGPGNRYVHQQCLQALEAVRLQSKSRFSSPGAYNSVA